MTAALLLFSAGAVATAGDLTMNPVLYSEKEASKVTFVSTDRAPKLKLEGTVAITGKHAMIELLYSKLEPALLFGGDVNAWVVWAITPDGQAQNLGELPVREDRGGNAHFATSNLNFAMIVTAEPFAGVRRPSDLVAFISQPVKGPYVQNTTAPLTRLQTGTKRSVESIAGLEYKDKVPVELAQARQSMEILDRSEAPKYAPKATESARVALAQANDAYAGRENKSDVSELSRRALDSATRAGRETIKAMEAEQADVVR